VAHPLSAFLCLRVTTVPFHTTFFHLAKLFHLPTWLLRRTLPIAQLPSPKAISTAFTTLYAPSSLQNFLNAGHSPPWNYAACTDDLAILFHPLTVTVYLASEGGVFSACVCYCVPACRTEMRALGHSRLAANTAQILFYTIAGTAFVHYRVYAAACGDLRART